MLYRSMYGCNVIEVKYNETLKIGEGGSIDDTEIFFSFY